VKATVNAYTGQVNLYEWNQVPSATNPDAAPDPVLKTWESAFPGVVQSQTAMPTGLIQHLRYPEDLFNIQRTLLAKYHVSDPKTFYNGTDFWKVPTDPTVPETVAQPAYYFSMSPNGTNSGNQVFSLTSSLVSLNLRNLTAYVSVNSQPGPDYGRFTLLEVPSDQATPGPRQVQNAIESTTAVSTQLSLLRQGGSRVTLGNLLSIPLDGGFLYVEPIYVKASGPGSFPELREVATFFNGTVGYQPTLTEALNQVFGVSGSTSPPGGNTKPPGGNTNPPTSGRAAALRTAIAQAQAAETAADAALKRGDLAAYAADQRKVQRALDRIASLVGSAAQAKTVLTPSTPATPTAPATPTPTPTATSTTTAADRFVLLR
jgi:uncharacterized membrane protein (UPF0182 family)